MTQYRRKSQVVEAFKWMPDHETMDYKIPLPEWLPEHNVADGLLRIYYPARTLYVLPNEWVLKQGTRIWTCKADEFEELYEPLGDK